MFDIAEIEKTKERIRHLEKMETLGLLVAGIAHDLNNILQPVIGYTNLLLEKFDSQSEDHEYLSVIADSAHRARSLVAQLVTFSSHTPARTRVADLVPVVQEAVQLVRAILPASISLRENVNVELLPVLCNPSRIHQMLVNLFVNSRQAIIDSGEITIELSTIELEGYESLTGTELYGKFARLAVTDSGAGIDSDALPYIFNPMYTTKASGKGTGLGLSTVSEIVHAYGGGITVSTELGTGSTFEVFLPLSDDEIGEPHTNRECFREEAFENVLLVDDEDAITKLGGFILSQDGYKVTVASDGRSALEIFAENPEHFDLVVADRIMPRMTGEILAHELRKIRLGIPIIFFSGSGDIDSSSTRITGEKCYFLPKPFTASEMRRSVRAALRR